MLFCCTAAALLSMGVVSPAAEPGVRAVSTVRADPRTGRLFRAIVPRPAPGGGLAPAIRRVAREAAQDNAVDPLLVESVIHVESNFNPFAVSPKGAAGLMQLIPATARRFGAADSFDVRDNITAGVKYLKYLRDMFEDDRLALAAYNAGEGAVLKYGGVPPYPETVQYVRKVESKYQAARRAQPAQPKADNAVAEGRPAEEPFRHLEVTTDEEGRIHLRTR